MAENKPEQPGAPAPGERHPGFEERDVNVARVWALGVVLVLLTLGAAAIAYEVFFYFRGGHAPASPAEIAIPQPPAPRLQPNPPADLKRMRAAEDQILGSYGWVDRQKGIVHVPVDRAIELLAQRGLPARPKAGPETAAADVSVPTESGLGPKMIQPGGPLAEELGK